MRCAHFTLGSARASARAADAQFVQAIVHCAVLVAASVDDREHAALHTACECLNLSAAFGKRKCVHPLAYDVLAPVGQRDALLGFHRGSWIKNLVHAALLSSTCRQLNCLIFEYNSLLHRALHSLEYGKANRCVLARRAETRRAAMHKISSSQHRSAESAQRRPRPPAA